MIPDRCQIKIVKFTLSLILCSLSVFGDGEEGSPRLALLWVTEEQSSRWRLLAAESCLLYVRLDQTIY